MLWNEDHYQLHFTEEETEAQRGKQAAQGNKVMELSLNPGSLAPETAPNHHTMLCWLIDGMNKC